VDGFFELQITDDPTFTTLIMQPRLAYTRMTVQGPGLMLEDCTRYYWRVKTDPDGPREGPYSEVWTFFVNLPGVTCPDPPFEPPHEPLLPILKAIAGENLNCRAGPSPKYEIEDTFFEGASADIHGRNLDSTWIYILSPNRNIYCWVWEERVTIEGDINTAKVIDVEPPPIEEPAGEDEPDTEDESETEDEPETVDCSQYTNLNACTADPNCEWIIPIDANIGSCKMK
jgi:hypothetical protein